MAPVWCCPPGGTCTCVSVLFCPNDQLTLGGWRQSDDLLPHCLSYSAITCVTLDKSLNFLPLPSNGDNDAYITGMLP